MKKGFVVSLVLVSFAAGAQNDTLSIPKDSVHQVFDSLAFTVPHVPVAHPSKVYTIKPAIDIPLTVAGTAWSLFAFTKIYSKDTSSVAQILALDKNDIGAFNRKGVSHYSTRAFDASNMLFYGSMPLPLFLLLDKHIRKDAGRVAMMYMESISVTGMLYTGAVYFRDKYRPYAYNPEVDMSRRVRGGAKNSFFAGHVALVGTSTFFIAKVFSDYHPESKIKWVFYSLAGLATGATGYLRYAAGEHFPTDVLIGVGIGTLSGILIPHFHKNKQATEQRLSLHPYYGHEKGIAAAWHF